MLRPPVDSPIRPLSIMTSASNADEVHSGVAWAKNVDRENAWDDLILTLGE